MSKKLLFVLQQSPYDSNTAQEAIDALLMAASYDFDVTVVFLNHGILQLVNHQNSAAIEQKNIAKMLTALPQFDISNIYIIDADLDKFNLNQQELILSTSAINMQQYSDICREHDAIVSF